MNSLRFSPEVFDDIAEAVAWYSDEGGSELARRFAAAFFAALPAITANPHAARCVHGEFRRILMKPFPYKIYFRIHHDTVFVTLLVHAARDPSTAAKILKARS